MEPNRIHRVFVAVLLVAAAVAVAGLLWAAGNTEITVWGDRDLWRALGVPRQWPVLGPETNGGMQTPGDAFYLLLSLFFAGSPSVLAANLGLIALFAFASILLGVTVAREISPLAGALVVAAFAGSGTLAQSLSVWNPGYIVAFATVACVAGYYLIKTGRPVTMAIAAAALAIGMQIHMQIFQVALGLALALPVYRRRLHWRHGLALLCGLVLPYLPALASAGFGLVTSASAVPSEAMTQYVDWKLAAWQKAQLVFDLFGSSGAVFAMAVRSGWSWVASLLVAADMLAALLAAAFLFGRFRSGWRPSTDRPVGVFALVTVVYLAVSLVSVVNYRHMAAAVPAASVMVGLAAEAAIRRLGRHGRAATAGAAVICGLLALRPAALGARNFADHGFFSASSAAQEEIAAALKPTFYGDGEAFEAHAALFQRAVNGRWQLVQGGVGNHMAFIYRSSPAPRIATDRSDCVAILVKAEANGDLRSALATVPALAGLKPTFTERPVESAHFLYLPYITADGNCLKTFPNAYVPTAFETAHLPVEAPPSADRSGDAAVFVLPAGERHFPLGVEIRPEAAGYVAVLHGRLLRGYTGLYFSSLVAPSLCLAGRKGVVIAGFGPVTVGSPQQGTLAPWRSPAFGLAEDQYELWLTGRDARQGGELLAHLGRLAVPAMMVEAPAAVAPGERPPEECLAGRRPVPLRPGER